MGREPGVESVRDQRAVEEECAFQLPAQAAIPGTGPAPPTFQLER